MDQPDQQLESVWFIEQAQRVLLLFKDDAGRFAFAGVPMTFASADLTAETRGPLSEAAAAQVPERKWMSRDDARQFFYSSPDVPDQVKLDIFAVHLS